MEYKVKQIEPARPKHLDKFKLEFIEKLFKNNNMIVQRKYDGERMLVHFNGQETYCTSRNKGKYSEYFMENQEKIKNIPHLPNLGYTIIDCEFYSNSWNDAIGVIHSLPERALKLQETVEVKFAVFDCLFYDGKDLRELPYSERLKFIDKVLNLISDKRFHKTEQYNVTSLNNALEIAKTYWDRGMEGLVLKNCNATYYEKGAMIKLKRKETIDVVVFDYKPGTGKFEGTVGALIIGYKENGKYVKVASVNCSTNENREWWRQQFENGTAIGRVIEIDCMEITGESLRHPSYVRTRDDKDESMVTRDTIYKN